MFIIYPVAGQAEAIGSGHDRNLCNRHFAYYEKTFNIPTNLLRAVSIVESGLAGEQGTSPWPWTFNAQGKGYFFKTKREAVAAVRALQRRGVSSIDVGCMQINLHYHPNAFGSLEEAFNPENNIAYAATFLQNNFARYNNWKSAVAAYHSETRSLGHPYAEKVLAVWRKAPNNEGVSFASLERYNRLSASNIRKDNLASLSARERERRMSSMMIKVYRSPSSVYAKYNAEKVAMVENITQNALHNFNKGKQLKAVTLLD